MNASPTTAAAADKTTLGETDVEKLWKAFGAFDADGSEAISVDELRDVMRTLGQTPGDTELRDLIKDVDTDLSGTIDFEEFKALMISRRGDHRSRLKLAFGVFDKDGSGRITAVEMRSVMSRFGLSDAELDEMVKEVDEDGDGSIGFDEFCKIMPDDSETDRRKDSIIPPPAGRSTQPAAGAHAEATSVAIPGAVTDRMPAARASEPMPEEAPSRVDPEVTRLKELLAKHPKDEKMRGTSRLQMQIGLFRLIQGAAYRCFRESFSANHETHLRVRNLPYRITEFVPFVKTVVTLYKSLGVVEEACTPVLDAVVQSISDEVARLMDRIQNWDTLEKTPEMLAEAKAMIDARSKSANAREKFAVGIEFAITMRKKHLTLGDVVEGVLAVNELNRLRELELKQELAPPPARSEGDAKDYLKRWNRVILSDSLETVNGAMMPVAYWYEDFMPKLLAAFSVSTAAEIRSNTVPDEAALDQWYERAKAAGEFERYGAEMQDRFPRCTKDQKLRIRQAWRLTQRYLNGVQKRRERLEFGRESGALSQYVSFIDVYFDRSDVKDAQMRVSFPYYIGPAVWRFFHTMAEIVCARPPEQQTAFSAVFKDFFKLFASMYPCPYCRHHLNAYVVQNKEVDMYPVEYLLLGHDPCLTNFKMSIDDKLSTVVDGPGLRLFLWKLHNTVSSSIARSEEWYHRNERAFYTTRYWPGVDSELARAKALKQISISTDRLYRIYGLLMPVGRLAGVRLELQRLLGKGDANSIEEACAIALAYITELEAAVVNARFLQDTYRFDPDMVDTAPAFTPEEEEFGRSGEFVEV